MVAIAGWLAGAAYNAATPDRYEGAVYPTFVNVLVLTSICLGILDSLNLIKRAISFWRSGNRSWAEFKTEVINPENGKWLSARTQYEMVGLRDERFSDEPEIIHDEQEPVFALGDDEEEVSLEPQPNSRPRSLRRQWTPPSRSSTASDHTLAESPRTAGGPGDSILRKITSNRSEDVSPDREPAHVTWGDQVEEPQKLSVSRLTALALTWIRRTQVVFAYVTLLAGIVTYTGMCRASFINSCAAHYIKGSIFFLYGLLTFARYLGAYADLGWAWNRRPDSLHGPSAEMVECSVIFVYGITNTWLERLGAQPGSAYTVKQVQHISIAVM